MWGVKAGVQDGELEEPTGLEDAIRLPDGSFDLRHIHHAHERSGEVERLSGIRKASRIGHAVGDPQRLLFFFRAGMLDEPL